MDETRSQQLARIRDFCLQKTRAVLFDEPGGMLMDVFSTRTVPLDLGDLQLVEERANSATQAPYLLLVYGDGRQRALSDVGIGFAPVLDHTGPMPELPAVVCLRDYAALRDRLKHELYGHRERAPTRDALRLVMMCIAILDGARAQGFEVGREEKELEVQLRELESRTPHA